MLALLIFNLRGNRIVRRFVQGSLARKYLT
jgi:hypothetical protein